MNDYDATLNEAVATAPGQENFRFQEPAKYPRLVHANESGNIRILADAPGRFIVLRNGHVLYCGTPTECRTLYNELIGKL